jgi:hypothetical protein
MKKMRVYRVSLIDGDNYFDVIADGFTIIDNGILGFYSFKKGWFNNEKVMVELVVI